MKIRQIYEDGRIVKGVNTTVDVDTNQIPKEAAKFGNTVDKDGRPPTLSSKVKGKSTNVLFNLGLTEGIRLRLERDKNMDVLHIQDTNEKHRVEVRGKKGYETDGYDPNDKLHQVLDRVGKAANISELMNGEVIDINPNHPQGNRAIRTARDVLQTEASGPRMDPKDVEFDLLADAEKRRLAGEYKKLGPKLAITTWGAGLAHGIATYLGGQYLSALESFLLRQGAKRFTENKLREALGEIASATEIYVDMDGVLADFFGDWAKLMNVDHWTDIGKDNIDNALEKIRQTDDFWIKLPLTSNAKNLLNLIKQVKGKYKILSSPLPGDPNSEPHKHLWIEKHLGFFPPEDVIITHDKAKYATQQDGTPNILIDDYGMNIQKWEAAGGYGFKHKDHKFERTAQNIKQHMQEPSESYTRTQLPQIRNKNLKNMRHTIECVSIEDIIPVQKERIIENFKRQVDNIAKGKYNPIIVDRDNKIVNGHHRYEAAKLMGYELVEVAKLPFTVKEIVENFADGKKKGKSRPGRVKRSGASCKGSVTALRKRAKNASGEKAKMYHWCANMKSGRKKK